jgi:acyl-CoA reductase-like NAD-dependent aldehyde dehydrogenase
VKALTTNSGQICFAATRLYVQEGIYDKFINAYIEGLRKRTKLMGNPNDDSSEIGPVVDNAQFERIMDIIESAKSQAVGTLLFGGKAELSTVRTP